MLKELLTILFLATGTQSAFAQSTINPALPASGLPYSSSVIRGQFDNAYNDINALYGRLSATTGLVATLAALQQTPTASYPSGVWRKCYDEASCTAPLFYQPKTGTCAANSWVNDGGSCVNTTAGDGNSWLATWDQTGLDLSQWGATPGQPVDTAIDAAFVWVCAAHSTIRIRSPGANSYVLESAHVIGNGSAVHNSDCNNVSIILDPTAVEFTVTQNNPFLWTGSTGVIPFTFQGPMAQVTALGLGVDCNNLCTTAIKIHNTLNSDFGWLSVRNNVSGPAIIVDPQAQNIWGGGVEGNRFHDWFVSNNGTGGSGLKIGDTTSGVCDFGVISNQWDNINVSWDGGTAGTYGVLLGTATQQTFLHGRFQPFGAGGLGYPLKISPPPCDSTTPSNITFLHPTMGPPAPRDPSLDAVTWNPAGGAGIHFISYGTAFTDAPSSAGFGYFWGDTDDNYSFPGPTAWTPALKFGGAAVGMTYGARVGRLTKSGENIRVQAEMTLTAKGSSTGAATVTGFPYGQNTAVNGCIAPMFYANMGSIANNMMSIVGKGTTTIGLYNGGTTSSTQAADTNFTDTSIINIDCNFTTD